MFSCSSWGSSRAAGCSVFVVALLAGACNNSADLGVFDLSTRRTGDAELAPPPDLSAAPDLSTNEMFVGNGFVVDSLLVPLTRADYAMDLNGDGKKDNQLGNVISTLMTENLDAQGSVSASIANGSVTMLLELHAADPTLVASGVASVTEYVGKSRAPDWSGTGMYTVDAAQKPSTLGGQGASGHFSSEDPVTTRSPVSLTLKLAIVPGGSPVSFVVNGAHIQFDVASSAGHPTLVTGQINGSIKNADVQSSLMPAIATLLTQKIQANPNGATEMTIAGLFDTGGCSDGNVMAKAKDGVISPCEVAQNGIIMAVLAPDVQIYDSVDPTKYAPNPKNTVKDSISIGLAFHAVSASFTTP